MTAAQIATTVRRRVVVENIAQSCISSAFKPGCIQTDEMFGSQFIRIVAGCAEYIFLLHVFSMPAGVVAVVLTGSTHVAALAVIGWMVREFCRRPDS